MRTKKGAPPSHVMVAHRSLAAAAAAWRQRAGNETEAWWRWRRQLSFSLAAVWICGGGGGGGGGGFSAAAARRRRPPRRRLPQRGVGGGSEVAASAERRRQRGSGAATAGSRSVLQEQRWNNQGQAVQVWKAELQKETYLLPGTKEIQVDEGRNYYPTSFNVVSLVPLSKTTKKYSLGPHFFIQKPP